MMLHFRGFCIVLLVAAVFSASALSARLSLEARVANAAPPKSPLDEQAAAEVFNRNNQILRQIRGVAFVSISLDPGPNQRFLVTVQKLSAELKSRIPQTVGGIPVRIKDLGMRADNSPQAADKIAAQYQGELMKIPGVVAVFGGNNQVVVAVNMISPALQSKIPQKLGGLPVRLQQTYEDEMAGDFITQYSSALLKIPGVFAVGAGHDEAERTTIFVTVRSITPEMLLQIPKRFGSYPVMFEKGEQPVLGGVTGERLR